MHFALWTYYDILLLPWGYSITIEVFLSFFLSLFLSFFFFFLSLFFIFLIEP